MVYSLSNTFYSVDIDPEPMFCLIKQENGFNDGILEFFDFQRKA